MNKTISVLLFSAIGGSIGGLISSLFVQGWKMWLCGITCAVAMYLAYEWRATLRAIRTVYAAMTSKERNTERAYLSLAAFMLFFGNFFFILAGVMLFDAIEEHSVSAVLICSLFSVFVFFVDAMVESKIADISPSIILRPYTLQEDLYKDNDARANRRFLGKALLATNPLYNALCVLFLVAFFLRAILFAIPAIVLFLARFSWSVFILIHSERRVIVGLSVFVGLWAGNLLRSAHSSPVASMLIGAAAGAIWGFVSYAFITQRWLIPHGYVKAPTA